MTAAPGPPPYTAVQIAQVCHEANRAMQLVNGDPFPSLPWEEEDEETREFATAAVGFAMRGGTPEEQFREWSRAKADGGWTHGPVKDPDAKTHPSLVPDYAALPACERAKDAVFAAVVRAMTDGREADGGTP